MKILEYLVGGHVSGLLNAPVQQYCGSLKATHALLQAITFPSDPLTASSDGQTAFTLALQLDVVQVAPEPPCGATERGKLKPSTRLRSKKSCPLSAAIVNSTRDAGGAAPLPLHVTWPEPQSAVTQVNLPEESVEHCVRAQKRPFQGEGTSRVFFCLGC